MKKLKYLTVLLSFVVVMLSACLLWNLSIAADERILALEFLESNGFMIWSLLFSSLVLFVLELIMCIKKNR